MRQDRSRSEGEKQAPETNARLQDLGSSDPTLFGVVTKESTPDGSATEYMYGTNPPFYTDFGNPFPALVVQTVASSGTPSSAAVEQRSIGQNGNLVEDTSYDWIPYSQLTHESNGYLTGFSGGTAAEKSDQVKKAEADTAAARQRQEQQMREAANKNNRIHGV